MDSILFFKSLIIGFSIAAPVGPIGLLCIQRTLNHGLKVGFSCGLGAATADALYGAIGAFGLSFVTLFFSAYLKPMSLIGALILALMGIKLLIAKQKASTTSNNLGHRSFSAFSSTLLLTLANPMTILSFVAIFAALSSNVIINTLSATTMIIGVFIGSALWWLSLSSVVALIRNKINPTLLQSIERGAGFLLLSFAIRQFSLAI